DQIEHRDALGDARGVVVARWHEDDAVAEPDAAGARGAPRREHPRRRGGRGLLREGRLDPPRGVDPEPGRQTRPPQAVAATALLAVGLPGPRQLVLVEDAELHRRTVAGGAYRVKARRGFQVPGVHTNAVDGGVGATQRPTATRN